jgi:hypothetical protein
LAQGKDQQRLEPDENLPRQYLEPPLGLVARIDGLDCIILVELARCCRFAGLHEDRQLLARQRW